MLIDLLLHNVNNALRREHNPRLNCLTIMLLLNIFVFLQMG
nr:MAG TPA: hypothetical protein [Caudoviricetes sp.]